MGKNTQKKAFQNNKPSTLKQSNKETLPNINPERVKKYTEGIEIKRNR